MISPNFIFLGVFLQLIGGFSYIRDTLKGKIKPNKVSWLLWSIVPFIAFVAEIQQGVGILSLATFILGFVPLLVFIASFFNKKAEWKIQKLDIICGILSFMGLILWLITDIGNFAILFSIMADLLAGIPTVVKSYTNPESENDVVYLFGFINAGIALLTISLWNFEHFAYPIYLLIVNIILVTLIRFKIGKKLSFKFH
ncbi:hypothetical protein A2X44_04550 [candidate division CPR3 bacterium GWF2_35_18]|uniref:Uncharacterized protein n=1 Tax=candidate division CPR3 bacterium GW2011_GWF2_35_18 TaxID=1618350 RepID=A0A0G0BIY1_UNCC3|nr:MAG: hypothetical protein UR67_C0007G0098 [candidate division CPR3 bacterium GW2011_GWF2_35_18]KKP85241.1 MAG: hypothetical protein UR87_C0057G0003 [candidate division CPR3 bacterium GW2011_GWE2_35_7]OGB62622.1 MAG: hypothetical protein A2X44_04550 [candidate division CPR3 bacterium GWF2_35_18]OGB65872.1 MAG: hypothetical protein A2250_01800 [candidate division CPR3 bacterium RIFOXYA2_FULL_35_13]OGB76687.1 MAG: hypothetical protein A2476_03610 [candidate division CPR3 bacterium RIFOXYC2_FULL